MLIDAFGKGISSALEEHMGVSDPSNRLSLYAVLVLVLLQTRYSIVA